MLRVKYNIFKGKTDSMFIILKILFLVTWTTNLDKANGLNRRCLYDKPEELYWVGSDPASSGRNFTIVGDQFMRDGAPFQIISGSIHYFRVPAEYWRDRLLKLKAVGANTVSTYIEWSTHEPEERQYMFEGAGDIKKFIETAVQLEFLVILRFGPYINSERDMGGLPYWLLSKYPGIKLRTSDRDFIEETKIWIAKLFSKLGSYLYGRGGPVILVQIENEYDMGTTCDSKYKELLRDMVLDHVGTDAILYTTDPFNFKCGSVNGTLTTIDFGPVTDVKATFQTLRNFMKHGPLMNSEFHTGWLTLWGDHWNDTDIKGILKVFKYIMDNKISVNMYMFLGGTNFGLGSGAKNDNGYYHPVTTSYDFYGLLNEAGDMTPKYWAIRKFMKKYLPDLEHIKPPNPTKKGAYGNVTLHRGVSLLSAKGRSTLGKRYGDVTGALLPTFEQLRQRAGLILYETKLDTAYGSLEIKKPRDRVYVYIDGQYKGIIDRERNHFDLSIFLNTHSALSLLVENQGRLSFSFKHGMDGIEDLRDFKGIRSNITLNNKVLAGKWNITGYTLNKIDLIPEAFEKMNMSRGPILYMGVLSLPNEHKPLETFLDTTGWGKGYAWVNGHNLGRYWPGRGPLVTLYVPGVWLRTNNTVQLLELESAREDLTIQFIDHPKLLQRENL